jgi:class 3 adenylate cyclase
VTPGASGEQRRLTTIMFTDMVGYSALSQRNEALALELLQEHRQLLRAVFARHGGREIEAVGDGFFVEFPSALAGARCAVEIQQGLHDRNATAPPERAIQVRIGLHVGDVVVQDTHVHGDGVNIAARIEPPVSRSRDSKRRQDGDRTGRRGVGLRREDGW